MAVVRLSIFLCAALAALPAGALSFRSVAITGDSAPGTGETYEEFGLAVINQAGEVAFTATLSDADLGTWSEGSGSLALVQRQGEAAAGGTGDWDVAISPPALNDAGEVAFRATTTGPTRVGIWQGPTGGLSSVALSGEQAAGAPAGQDYTGAISEPTLNDAGEVAFEAALVGSGVSSSNDGAIWVGSPGSLAIAAREGDVAPGAGTDTWTGFSGTRINGSGDVAFHGTLDDGGAGGEGIWAGSPGSVALVARDGDAAAGTGGVFEGFFAPDHDDLGQVAFAANLEVGTGGVGFGDDAGVWSGSAGSLGLIAREGATAPASGTRTHSSFDGVRTNDVGEVLFRSILSSGTGLYLHDGGALGKVAASGDAAPGTELTPGLGDASFGSFTDWSLNDFGEVAFTSTLSGVGAGVTGDNDGTLWLLDRFGTLRLIVREGDLFEYAPGVFGIIEAIHWFGDSDVRGRGLNDEGWLTFGLTFTNGDEGVFAAIPEPGTGALVALGMLTLALRRRRA